ncbi:unnamed protein product [Allacma fusca]|uniref:Uncharacterized protein n=1 Tax=Allacma fusca TaxID=39272 RepID=A0A8J2L333_9HEXA|nr:unnamed protein product [Allacma fusca]
MATEKSETRVIAKLKVYDPNVSTYPSTASVIENSSSWSFFEHEKESYLHCEFIFCGKKNTSGGVTVVRFSLYEGTLLRKFISRILDEITIYAENGKTETIPFFESNPDRVLETLNQGYRDNFREICDIELESVGRVVFNRVHGSYELILNCPVSAEVTKKLKGWVGPTLYFSYAGMKDFLLIESLSLI